MPVITNKGIGDIEEFFKEIEPGFLFDEINLNNFQNFINNISLINKNKNNKIREKSRKFFDIKKATDLYKKVYLQLE